MCYVLITPVKNEEEYLPSFINSVLAQTILPIAWVIVDGDSKDNTLQILGELEKENEFVYVINQPRISGARGHLNFSMAVNSGYKHITKLCSINNIKYDYVGKIDADSILPPNYFEKLLEKFKDDSRLGVASGATYNISKNYEYYEYNLIKKEDLVQEYFLPDELPDKRLYRKECLEQIGGFPITLYSPDSVMLAKSRLRGWKVKWFEDVIIYNMRKDTGTERNVWRAYEMLGESKYYLNYHPVLFLSTMMYTLTKPPYYFCSPFPILYGYINAMINGQKINDKEICVYFKKKRLKEIVSSFKLNLLNKL